MEDNKLIAEFMGYRECPQKLFRMDDEFQSVTIYSEYQQQDEYLTIEAAKRQIKYTPNEMEFHKSWDWLMPVIDKCYQEHMSKRIADAVMTCNRDEAYKVVVEFIKQYNK